MKKEVKKVDSTNIKSNKNIKRDSCLLIAVLGLVLFIVLGKVVSKELSSAFKTVNKGLEQSNQTYDETNEALMNALLKNNKYGSTVEKIENISSNYTTLLDSTIQLLIVNTGGWNQGPTGKELVNPKNFKVPTKILVTDKLGDKIEQAISSTSIQYNEILKQDLKIDTVKIPLNLRMDYTQKSSKSWANLTFNQVPLSAVLPLLRKYKNDEKQSKSIIYRIMANEK